MEHLTMNEMIDFVSAEELNDHFLELAAKVNGHLCECDACRQTVSALQAVREGLLGTMVSDMRNSLKETVGDEYLQERYENEKDAVDDAEPSFETFSR